MEPIFTVAAKCFEEGDVLLDYGLGDGENSLKFARLGYQVEGLDSKFEKVQYANLLAKQSDLEERAFFLVGNLEKLIYPDAHFNFITGANTLQSENLEKTLLECKRVLKTGGLAVFKSPIENPFWDKMLRLSSREEKKLTLKDIDLIRSIFPKSKFKRQGAFKAIAGEVVVYLRKE